MPTTFNFVAGCHAAQIRQIKRCGIQIKRRGINSSGDGNSIACDVRMMTGCETVTMVRAENENLGGDQ